MGCTPAEWLRQAITLALAAGMPPVELPPEEGVVYFMERLEDGLIKIGRSVKVESRLRSLESANACHLDLLAVTPGGPIAEAHLHCRFADYRRKGEWFVPGPRLMAFIGVLRAGQEPLTDRATRLAEAVSENRSSAAARRGWAQMDPAAREARVASARMNLNQRTVL